MGLELLIRGICHLNLTYQFLYHYRPTVWALPLFLYASRKAANIDSKGLYGALRVLFGIGLEACWLDQAMDLTGGLILG